MASAVTSSGSGTMAEKTKISWTNSTVNFWIGCTKVSAGCKNCYAEKLVERGGKDFSIVRRTSNSTFYSALHWKTGRMIFTCSLSDFFHKDADVWRKDAWNVIKQTPQHTWQILTKRPERIKECLPADWGNGYSNVWLGTSVEHPLFYSRILHLTNIPAKTHFLSCEPLLADLIELPLHHIEWVIVGGESGHNFRPMKIEWVKNIQLLCRTMHIPFFYKQPAGLRNELPAFLNEKEIKEMPEYA